MDEIGGMPRISARIQDGSLHYGDPPNMNCCAAGPTMNSEPVQVLEFWRKTRGAAEPWERDPALEGPREWGWG